MKKPFLVAGCVLAFTAPLAFADTTWISTGTPLWATAGNWNNGVPTGAGFAVVVEPLLGTDPPAPVAPGAGPLVGSPKVLPSTLLIDRRAIAGGAFGHRDLRFQRGGTA